MEKQLLASNTNILIKGITHGLFRWKKSRVFYSPDKGNSWTVFDNSIVQGKAMTGILQQIL
jgi:hypothetical protein